MYILTFFLSLFQDVFQQHIGAMLQNSPGIPGEYRYPISPTYIINIADDIIIFEARQDVHDNTLEALMVRAE